MMKKIIMLAVLVFTGVSFAGCASFDRSIKSFQSEVGNGLNRELVIKSPTGETLYTDEGKFDIEVSDTRVKYIDEEDKLHIIYLGTSTAIVNEK